MDTMKIILMIIGGIIGAVSGYFIGKYRIYYSIGKTNTIGDDSLSDTSTNGTMTLGNKIMVIICGLFFVAMGGFIMYLTLTTDKFQKAPGTMLVFSAFAMIMGGICVYCAIAGKSKNN